jgi:hypothetical protein
MPLDYILETRLILNSYPYNMSDDVIDKWSFWKFQDKINRINTKNRKAESNADSINVTNTMNLLK